MSVIFKDISKELTLQAHTIKALGRLGLYKIKDLLLHKPHSYIRKIVSPNLSKLNPGDHIVTEVTIREITRPQRRGGPLKIYADNETGGIVLIFFNKLHPFVFSQLKIGAKKTIEGKVDKNDFYYQIAHPELVFNSKHSSSIEPIYPLTYGINNKQLHSYILKAIDMAEDVGDELLETFKYLHAPKALEDTEKAIAKMAKLELLANQLTLARIRKQSNKERGRAFPKAEELQQKILSDLNFTLSSGQEAVIKEIEEDQAKDLRMTRMLQGDVGAGKTLVALMTILNVLVLNVQSALMAPTDLLATQHFGFFTKALGSDKVALLTSKTKPLERKKILEQLASGEILVLIGTHALFQSKVTFSNLGYIVIDEQHRFGVAQRIELLAKADNPDLLLMTATPIPRSLTLTLFGDMAVSKLTSKPQNRPEIKTVSTSMTKTQEVIISLQRKMELGEKIYWICPLIEQQEPEKDTYDLSDVLSRYNSINDLYPGKVGLLHGKLSADEKDRIMTEFKDGAIDILVSTTVIEVGIDVPAATLIVIENAERFGLAQLHQLRGRVGRGTAESHCVLLYKHLGGVAKERIEIMRKSSDGFYISEEDLKLRGGGEILGMKQSGQQDFYFADLAKDVDLLIECSKKAEKLIDSKENELIIKLFDRGLISGGLGG